MWITAKMGKVKKKVEKNFKDNQNRYFYILKHVLNCFDVIQRGSPGENICKYSEIFQKAQKLR